MIRKPSKGAESTQQFHQAMAEEERRTEAKKRSDLKKGAERFEERAKSADGRSAGDKQQR